MGRPRRFENMNLAAKQFDLRNARTLATLSALAYTDEANVHSEDGQIHGLITETEECITITIRGTDSIRDWITDAEFFRKSYWPNVSGLRVEVHAGFLAAFYDILGPVIDRLLRARNPRLPIFGGGHSLGGALMQLLALELQRQGFVIGQVYTFGQPRVGNRAFARYYDSMLGDQTFRVVYQEDIVPRVPHLPAILDPYWHSETEIFFPATGPEYETNPSFWRLLRSDAWGWYRAFCLRHFAGALDPITDHHVRNYQDALWQLK